MSGWTQGHDTIARLLERGHLERISGGAANGAYLVDQARQRLGGARAALLADRVGAFELAYGSARQAITAALLHQGLRPRLDGGQIAVAEAAAAQFGQPLQFFNTLRRVRNLLEYPRTPDDLVISERDVNGALAYAETTVALASTRHLATHRDLRRRRPGRGWASGRPLRYRLEDDTAGQARLVHNRSKFVFTCSAPGGRATRSTAL